MAWRDVTIRTLCTAVAAALFAFAAACAPAVQGDGNDGRFTVTAVVERFEPISGEGYCPGARFERCEVYRIHLSNSRPELPCPLIAIEYWDDTGHRYVDWPATIVFDEARKRRLLVIRNRDRACSYVLIDAE